MISGGTVEEIVAVWLGKDVGSVIAVFKYLKGWWVEEKLDS